jgi:septum formation protein
MRLILASASPRRLDLLERIGVTPDAVVPADIDESVPRGELPRDHALRLAREKAAAVAAKEPDALVLAADTVVAVGRRILPKVEDEATLRACMRLLSGRRHRVLTGVALAIPERGIRERLGETMIAMKSLSEEEIDYYASHGEWRGKAGGYGIQGYAGTFVQKIVGSYTAVVGLPLYESIGLLTGEGYQFHAKWEEGAP